MPQIRPAQIKQSGATSSQVLTWNGTAWVPAAPTGGAAVVVFASVEKWRTD